MEQTFYSQLDALYAQGKVDEAEDFLTSLLDVARAADNQEALHPSPFLYDHSRCAFAKVQEHSRRAIPVLFIIICREGERLAVACVIFYKFCLNPLGILSGIL